MTHPFSDGPLPFGKIVDCGIVGYHEFACSRATFGWLSGGAMRSVDGVPVRLQVMDECVGGFNVFVKVWSDESSVPEAWTRDRRPSRRYAPNVDVAELAAGFARASDAARRLSGEAA